MNKADRILWKCDVFYKKATLNPFDKSLDQRGWGRNDGQDIWSIESDIPYLLGMKDNEQALDEWVNSLQMRIGLPPTVYSNIKDIVRRAWGKEDSSEEYGDLMYYLRQYSRTDPVWIEKNTRKTPLFYDDEF